MKQFTKIKTQYNDKILLKTTLIIIIMIKLLTKLTKLTKVVFGKNSDRPEGEVQEVVEVGCFLQIFLLCLLLFIVVDVACSS